MTSRDDKRSNRTPRPAAPPKTTTPSSDSSAEEQPAAAARPTPGTTTRKRRTKPKPSFELDHGPLVETPASWVYRSEPQPAEAAVASPIERSAIRPLSPPAVATARRLAPRPPASGGLDLLVMPFALALTVLFVPLRSLFAPRDR